MRVLPPEAAGGQPCARGTGVAAQRLVGEKQCPFAWIVAFPLPGNVLPPSGGRIVPVAG